jgi:hypothetical protein
VPQPQQSDYGCVSIPFLYKRLFGHTVPVPNWFGYLIRIGTRSRYDHAFIYIGNGKIIEAQPQGAVISDLSKYKSDAIIWSNDKLPPATQLKIINLAYSKVGTPYGFLDIIYLALAIVGIKNKWLLARVEREDRLICSQLVALCGEGAGAVSWLCGKPNACLVTPANLAMRAKISSLFRA